MDLTPIRTEVAYDDQTWIGSKHGLDAARSGTLLVSDFTVEDDGYIKSGTPVIYNAGTKLYELAPTGAPCDGHIEEMVRVNPGSIHVGFSLHWHGVVIVAQLPGDFADDFDLATDGAPHILYV